MSSSDAELDAIERLLNWGDAVGGEIGGAWEISECRRAIAADLRCLGVTDEQMSAAVRRGIRKELARRVASMAEYRRNLAREEQ